MTPITHYTPNPSNSQHSKDSEGLQGSLLTDTFSREILHRGKCCWVVTLSDGFELQSLEGRKLGMYSLVTDALEEADAYDQEIIQRRRKWGKVT